jgi:hypothetical protein
MSAQATSGGSYLTKNERGGPTAHGATTGPSDHRLEQRILSMKPEHETRRKIIREWMALPKDKRQTEEQAKPFAKKAMERIPSSGDPYRQIMRWLLPRIGKP